MSRELTLYMREGCHLCEAFIEELNAAQARWQFSYQIIDIDESTQYLTRFHARVPVLMYDDQVICEHFLDENKLAASVL